MESVSKSSVKTADGSSKAVSGISTALGGIGIAAVAAATAVATAFVAISKEGIKVAGDLESARQGFVALLGSAEDADDVMARIKKEAKATPFELSGLVTGTQALTAITKDGDKAIDILLDVGKAVAISGKGQSELDRTIYNLQQISATGKVTAMDIRQFQSAVPVFNDILSLSGLTVEQLQESENAATLLFDAFNKFGTEGIGAEGFSAQAGTWNQLVSNMKDTWAIFTSDFVTELGVFDLAKEVVAKLTEFMETKLLPAILKIKEWFEKTWITVQEYWDLYGQPVFDMIVDFIEVTIIPAWEKLKESIKKAMEESGLEMEDFKKILGIVAVVIGGVLLGAVLLIIGAIGGLIFVIAQVIDWSVQLRQKMKEEWQKIKDEIQWHVDKIKAIFNASTFKEGLLKALKYPFEAFWRWISQLFDNIKNKIQDALDLTKRHSPSVIDRLKAGINLAEKELDKLTGIQIAPMGTVMAQGLSGSSAGGINLSIDMAGANISSPDVAQEYAEQIGNAIVGKLRTNRRSYV
jgi:tape measure domain-containing protein